MNTQPSTPYQRHSATSRTAAARAEPMAGTGRARVLDQIRSWGRIGMTDEEVQQHIPMGANTERPRRVDLVRGGYVVDSGRTRPTASGTQSVVWVAIEFTEVRG